ncbi:hypothetical protein F4680DRAFT_455626 [Xylaria scruposa]|nr:hypothetical protein F4680DRAFT_455626 [Xylaria scruposa]
MWRDWSRGSVLGNILTLSRFDGNLVIAFTAFFVAFVATRFWLILSNTLHHQQQVILRNSPTPEAALLSLLQLWWAWRSLGFRRRIKVLSVSVLAASTMVAFIVAGGFSASISSSVGDKVLIKSSNCGTLISPSNITQLNVYDKVNSELISNTVNYAQQCYSAARSGLLNCNRFIKDHIPSTVDYNVSCPFSNGICQSNTSNIQLDSGPINVNNDLGLNGNETRKISLRYVLTCAPLITKGYTSEVNTSDGGLVRYHYGQRQVSRNKSDPWQNFTYQASSLASQYLRIPERFGDRFNSRFQLNTVVSRIYDRQPNSNSNDHLFISDLFRPDGDISITFLEGNGVVFNERMDDDWYRGIILGGNLSTASVNGTYVYYTPYEAASPLGCLTQYQYCYAEQCGPLASFNDAISGAVPIFNITDYEMGQRTTRNLPAMNFFWVASILFASVIDIAPVVNKLGPLSLASQSSYDRGIQFVTSQPDQWKQDTENWFNITLASLQSIVLSVVLRPADSELKQVFLPPQNYFQKAMCNSQTIRSTGYTSFSVFGLLFTYTVGGLIIIVSVVIDPVLSFLRRRCNYQTYEQLEWETNHYLQLHRLAQEELGYGEWARCIETVPITGDDEVLGSLNIQDLDHPVIANRGEQAEKNDNSEAIDSNTANTATEESLPPENDPGETQPRATASTSEQSGGLELAENGGVPAASKAK